MGTKDNGLKMIEAPDEMFDETAILVDNDEANAPIFDKMKFTTSDGDWYGWDSVCASLDRPTSFGKVCSSDCDECPNTNMAQFDHICVDNENYEEKYGCGPSKQLLILDEQRPNEYVAAIWKDGSDIISESLLCPSRSRLLGAKYQYDPDPCELPKVVGPCRAAFPRYYYDASRAICERFFYGGCNGNANNFHTQADCEAKCGVTRPHWRG